MTRRAVAPEIELAADLAADPAWLLLRPDDGGDPNDPRRPAKESEVRELVDRFLSPEEREAFQRWVDDQAPWRADPATMAHHLTEGRLKLWRYVRLLGDRYRAAVRGESKRQIWEMPARYGKTMWGAEWGPAWALDSDPRLRLMNISYGDERALETAYNVRSILRSYELRAQLRGDRQRADRFLTIEGGGLLAAGIDASIAGWGADGVTFDDPFKNWQEAHSQARRDHVDNQYRAVVTLRLESDDAFIIIATTRWHQEDLPGRLQARMEDGTGEAWEVVRIPALAEIYDPTSHDRLLHVRDPLGRAPGEPIEPERFSLQAVKSRHRSLASSYLIAALEQQRPSPEEGGEIKRAWFHLVDELPPAYDQCESSWDWKLKERRSGDYTVGQVWGRTGKDCWLIDQMRGQWSQAMAASAVALVTVRHPYCRRHVYENTGYGPEVAEQLGAPAPGYEISDDVASELGMTREERPKVEAIRRRGVAGLIPVTVKGSKVVRARAVAGYIEAGDVHVYARNSWVGAFLDECASFPDGSNDDQVDAMSQALARMHPLGLRRGKTFGEALRTTRAGVR